MPGAAYALIALFFPLDIPASLFRVGTGKESID
jgi:hypothetical protein